MTPDHLGILNTSGAFASAHARGETWRMALERCVEVIRPVLTPAPPDTERVGFAFVTDAAALMLDEVWTHLREATGIEHWVGAVGLGICGTGAEYFDEPAAAILVAALPTGSFRVFTQSGDGELRYAEGSTERGWRDTTGPAFGLVHADPQTSDLPGQLQALARKTATGFLVGGLASSGTATGIIANGGHRGAIGGVMLDASVGVSTRLTQGCLPIGPPRQITRSDANVLIELDGRPALDAFRQDIGEELARDLRRVGGLIFAALPIPGSDTGDYLVRNLVGLDTESGALAIGEVVKDGDKVMFCRRDVESAREDLQRMLGEIKSGLGGQPVAGVYYSCLARGPNLFDEDAEELRIIEQILGRFPLAGFFGNGEISHDRLYAYTGVLTLFHA